MIYQTTNIGETVELRQSELSHVIVRDNVLTTLMNWARENIMSIPKRDMLLVGNALQTIDFDEDWGIFPADSVDDFVPLFNLNEWEMLQCTGVLFYNVITRQYYSPLEGRIIVPRYKTINIGGDPRTMLVAVEAHTYIPNDQRPKAYCSDEKMDYEQGK
jgi:hypothetical protein